MKDLIFYDKNGSDPKTDSMDFDVFIDRNGFFYVGTECLIRDGNGVLRLIGYAFEDYSNCNNYYLVGGASLCRALELGDMEYLGDL